MRQKVEVVFLGLPSSCCHRRWLVSRKKRILWNLAFLTCLYRSIHYSYLYFHGPSSLSPCHIDNNTNLNSSRFSKNCDNRILPTSIKTETQNGTTTPVVSAATLSSSTEAQDEAFSKLELFVSAYPGDAKKGDDDSINGFDELQSTFVRSLEFFWPLDKIQGMTVVLDDTVCSLEDRDPMTSTVKSLFRDDFATKISVRYNPRSNTTLYGKGWYIQQLIQFWADNFTDAEYIGFVDDDTLFTRAVHPTELFDELGRPRAIVRHMNGVHFYEWAKTAYYTFKRPVLVHGMTYFPVIIKRDHLKDIRQSILAAHPEFSYFDEFFQHLVKPGKVGGIISQFCIMMDYCFFHAKDSYSWHFDTWPMQWGRKGKRNPEINSGSTKSLGVTDEMLKPFPRVAIHGNYLSWGLSEQKNKHYKTKAGRKYLVNTVLRNGYCHSLRALRLSGHVGDNKVYNDKFGALCNATNRDDINAGEYDGINQRGEWTFEGRNQWVDIDLGGAVEAHAESMKRYAAQNWIRLRWDGV